MARTMDESVELTGGRSEDGSVMTPWDPKHHLEVAESTGSCKVMDPYIAFESLKKGSFENDNEIFPDSDDSELKRRRRRHRKLPDPLKKLLKQEIENLLSSLLWDLPLSAHIFSFIQLVIKWKNNEEMKRSGMKYKVLVAREECRKGHPLVIAFYIWKGEVKGSIYAPTFHGVQALREAFKYSKFWPVENETRGCEWAIYPAEAATAFLENWSAKYSQPHYTFYPVNLYWMSPDSLEILNFEVPREFNTTSLELGHVKTVNYYWPRHRTGSKGLVEQMILNNPTIGAFTVNDELICWALQSHYGSLDIFYTVQRHRRKGTARSLMVALAGTLIAEDSPAHVFAQRDDYGTNTFLVNSGFTFVTEYYYFYVDPPHRPKQIFKTK